MDREYGLLSSFEDVAAQVTTLEESVGVGEIPLVALQDTIELQGALQDEVADRASELMIGMRWRRERNEYEKGYGMYRRLLGAVALDLSNRIYDESGDTGFVKEGVLGYIEDSKRQMMIRDYEMRLEKSSLERSKQWLAHHKKTRFVLPLALSAMTTTALFKAGEASSSFVDMTPTQTGVMGVMTLMGSLAIRAALRNGPRQAGAVLKDQFNASLQTYMVGDPMLRTSEWSPDIGHLPEYYADRHFTLPLATAALYLNKYDVAGRDDFGGMVQGLLEITEKSMYDSYGIATDNTRQDPWYRRKARQVLPIDLAV